MAKSVKIKTTPAVKLTPPSDRFLFYVAGDDDSVSGPYSDEDDAIRGFSREFRRRSATWAMGVTDVSGGGYNGSIIWRADA